MSFIIILNTSIFVSISLLHAYWALGGKFGNLAASPTTSDGSFLFRPGPLSTWVVAAGLMFFAWITLGNLIVQHESHPAYIHVGTWIIGIIFIARSIGDFRYVGFFKKMKDTTFARNDSRLYSPLSLVMGLINILVAAQDQIQVNNFST